ncbi:hypothetical protein HOU26_gp15 [Escherichia phage IMM-002]|uniref:Uncharacterized protein n=1 Tax=Escherichia phage IMM-002 TaxID=2041760 RepID=A0A384WIE2_9CAUD|nr:hypothetical protein HOU26_gp15 [Escherichia phage IMM-002]ATI16974.1 hypothetical protein [Escherichia phage IMM-002]
MVASSAAIRAFSLRLNMVFSLFCVGLRCTLLRRPAIGPAT